MLKITRSCSALKWLTPFGIISMLTIALYQLVLKRKQYCFIKNFVLFVLKEAFSLPNGLATGTLCLLAAIPQQDRFMEIKDLDFDSDTLPVEIALGVQWCVQSDSFKFKIILKDRPLTSRGILSTISSIYDPLGFLAPIVLAAKRIIQDLCRSQLGWDDALPVAAAKEWTVWLQELHQLEHFKVDRWLKLHHFADASENGYGTVTYLLLCKIRICNGKGTCGSIEIYQHPSHEVGSCSGCKQKGQVVEEGAANATVGVSFLD